MKTFELLALLLLPGFCIGQSPVQNERLVTLTNNFINAYNENDSAQYMRFLTSTATDESHTQAFLHQLNQEHLQIGALNVFQIKAISPTETVALVQAPRYEAWWRVVVLTDSMQRFKEHHMGLVRVTDKVLQQGILPDAQLKNEVESYLRRQAKYQAFSGNILVEKKGKTIYAHSFGTHDEDQPNNWNQMFNLASISKMFTAVAILQLIDKNVITLETEVETILPDLKNKKLAHITIAQLLTHTSGTGDYFEDVYFAHLADSLKTSFTSVINTKFISPAAFLPFIERDSLKFEPGKDWRYSNTGFELLGIVIEKVSGLPYDQYIKESVFEKAGMKHAVAGTGSGNSWSTINDLRAFARALQGGHLLSEPLTKKMLQYTVNGSYGYGTEHQTLGSEHIIGHSGGFEKVCNELNIYEHAGITVIILSNVDPPLGHFLSDKIKQLLIPKNTSTTHEDLKK